ncbi:MAG: magnesium-dependent phosphatase-1 [Candidatus Bathyarchaeota archaeon]|nr:magnesium-dependent phosphatase-1 [Candidatus Bathyarchaeota archaeon]
MVIRLVVFDADMTLWDHFDVSSLKLPFKRVDENSLVDAKGASFSLFNGIRELLQELKKMRIMVALATWNKPEHVSEAIHLLEMEQFFTSVESEFHSGKHLLIKKILSKLSKEGIQVKPGEILYVDDRNIHLRDIRDTVGKVAFLQMWKDVKAPYEILAYLQRKGITRASGKIISPKKA